MSNVDYSRRSISIRAPSEPRRERQFIYKYGSKVHAYDPSVAPYPLSYDKTTLELEMCDDALSSAYDGVTTLVDFKGKPPKRCLDVGTGLGLWIIKSVKYWKETTFVGYDIMDVQTPLYLLDPDYARRIQWVYGNILTEPLPFQDEEFDHVRVTQIGTGIPEHKWIPVLEEIQRVMKPGGTIEMIEEDPIFPVLPRWFTEPLHARTRWPSINVSHEYELLEILFNKVFENRFVNTRPSSCIPANFNTVFSHVVIPPLLTVPMPPLPKLSRPRQPRPSRTSQTSRASTSSTSEPSFSEVFLPEGETIMSLATMPKAGKKGDPSPPPAQRERERERTKSSVSSAPSGMTTASSNNSRSTGSGSAGSDGARARSDSNASLQTYASKRAAALKSLMSESTSMGEKSVIEIFPVDAFLMFDPHTLCVHLRTALIRVLGVKEAMWLELQNCMAAAGASVASDHDSTHSGRAGSGGSRRPDRNQLDLTKYGWHPSEDTTEISRQRFDSLVDQYKHDVQVRMALWNSLVHFGWDYPQRDGNSQAAELEEIRLHQEIREARSAAGADSVPEQHIRAVRLLIAAKSVSKPKK